MRCGAGGSPRYNARYLACKGSPALSGRNQNNMPGSCSCRRASWLQSGVQTRGEEEQVNVEGAWTEAAAWHTQENLHAAQLSPGERQCSPMFAAALVWVTVE